MNAQNKKQVIIAGVLGVALVVVLVWQLFIKGVSPPKAGTAAGAKPPVQTAKTASPPPAGAADNGPMRLKTDEVDLDKLLEDIEVVTFDYQASRIERDPMAPLIGYIRPGETKAVLETPVVADVRRKKVTGIIWDEYDPVAVVDNELVSLGHTYPNGVEVYSIERDRVLFKVGDSLYPVEMKEL